MIIQYCTSYTDTWVDSADALGRWKYHYYNECIDEQLNARSAVFHQPNRIFTAEDVCWCWQPSFTTLLVCRRTWLFLIQGGPCILYPPLKLRRVEINSTQARESSYSFSKSESNGISGRAPQAYRGTHVGYNPPK